MTNIMKGKIFNAQEVQKMLNGSKIMFREVIKTPIYWRDDENSYFFGKEKKSGYPFQWTDKCPYQAGQKIFVKESYKNIYFKGIRAAWFRASASEQAVKSQKWLPPIALPQHLSRLTPLIKEIRVERLAEISEEDAIKEGATSRQNCRGYGNRDDGWSMDWSKVGELSKYAANRKTLAESDVCMGSAKYAFGNHWNATHKKPEEKFEANPWVWCVTIEVVK